MQIETLTPLKSLNPAYRKEKVSREAIDRLKHELPLFLDRTRGKISESTLRDHLQTLLRGVVFPAADFLVQSEVRRMDTVIHDGAKRKDAIGVIIEAKTTENSSEMFSPGKPNVKSLHELVLYFMRERQAGNTAIKNLVITDGDALYVIADKEFERLFWDKKRFRKKILAADADAGKNNDLTYAAIKDYVAELDGTLTITHTQLELFRTYCEDNDQETDAQLIPLYKILSPEHLLRRPFAGDSNHLDKGFYRELLHIIGLHEVNKKNGKIVKSGGKKVIERLPEGQRHPASLLENTLQVATKENRFRNVKGLKDYGSNEEERHFSVALELCLTWVNRILFLKLLETQLSSYHQGDKAYRFLSSERIPDFDALNTLFFDVLNKPVAERESIVDDFARVPYLNSSLFEISDLEDQVLRVNSLKDQFLLDLAPQSVLGTSVRAQKGQHLDPPQQLQPLSYLFRFLNAYDFGGEGRASIQEDNKRLINASVLGLIFEKINGYRDGSFYTPGFITEYMCRQTIRRAVVQKFRDDREQFADFDADDFDALRNYLRRDGYKPAVRTAANALVNAVTVCDPAVGSGHFLVSALNELIATKSALGILGADAGAVEVDIKAVVENDELLVSWRRDGEPYEYHVDVDSNGQLHVPREVQTVQETLFQEKRTLIENCLFGVDLNPNSVKICRLRLWIELLKNAYYVLDERSEQSRLPSPPERSRGRGHEPSEHPRAAAKSHTAYRDSHIAYLQTLPNIDINIKQGNSLISRFALDDDLSDALKDSNLTLADYRQAVTDYHRAQGRDSKEQLLDVIDRIKNNFQTHISRNDKRVQKLAKARGKLTKLQGLLEIGDLFGSVDEKQVRKEIKPVQKQVDKLEAELASVRENAIYEQAFEWRFEFPAVLGEDGAFLGFDVVVGNPPYVDIKGLEGPLKKYLFDNFKTSENRINLYAAFIELGLLITRDFAGFSFIVPNSMLVGSSYKKLRTHVKDSLSTIIKLPDNVFEEATVETIIFEIVKGVEIDNIMAIVYPKSEVISIIDTSSSKVISKEFLDNYSSGTFNLYLTEEISAVIEKAVKGSISVESVTDISLGITPYDKYQGHSQEIIKSRAFHSPVKNSNEHRPLISGRNINHYFVDTSPKEYIKYGEWLGSARSIEFFTEPRNIVRQIIGENLSIVAGFTNQEAFFTQIGFSVISKDKSISNLSLTGLFNSKLLSFVHKYLFLDLEKKVFQKVLIQNFKQLPIVIPSIKNAELLESLVTNILTLKSTDPTADTSALEAEIDVLVYKLYGLTYAEVLVVDPGFGLSEGEYAAVEVG